MSAGDMMLSTNILLSGNHYYKIALLFNFMNMGCVTKNTFFRIQDAYCVDPIKEFWGETRQKVIDRLHSKDAVVVLGKTLVTVYNTVYILNS